MDCGRCGGLMVGESTSWEEREIMPYLLRCLICGERVEPTILKNRARQPAPCSVEVEPINGEILEHDFPSLALPHFIEQ